MQVLNKRLALRYGCFSRCREVAASCEFCIFCFPLEELKKKRGGIELFWHMYMIMPLWLLCIFITTQVWAFRFTGCWFSGFWTWCNLQTGCWPLLERPSFGLQRICCLFAKGFHLALGMLIWFKWILGIPSCSVFLEKRQMFTAWHFFREIPISVIYR